MPHSQSLKCFVTNKWVPVSPACVSQMRGRQHQNRRTPGHQPPKPCRADPIQHFDGGNEDERLEDSSLTHGMALGLQKNSAPPRRGLSAQQNPWGWKPGQGRGSPCTLPRVGELSQSSLGDSVVQPVLRSPALKLAVASLPLQIVHTKNNPLF